MKVQEFENQLPKRVYISADDVRKVVLQYVRDELFHYNAYLLEVESYTPIVLGLNTIGYEIVFEFPEDDCQ